MMAIAKNLTLLLGVAFSAPALAQTPDMAPPRAAPTTPVVITNVTGGTGLGISGDPLSKVPNTRKPYRPASRAQDNKREASVTAQLNRAQENLARTN